MCIICAKTGNKNPEFEKIKEAARSNPDGFSMIHRAGKTSKVFKTLSRSEILEYYKENCDSPDWILHFRIKTHGPISLENCHGWKAGGLVFAHNGILPIAARASLTDSETFFRDLFLPAYKAGGWKAGEKAISAVIGSSKFAFMEKSGIRLFGNYLKDETADGIFWSNRSYLPPVLPAYDPARFNARAARHLNDWYKKHYAPRKIRVSGTKSGNIRCDVDSPNYPWF